VRQLFHIPPSEAPKAHVYIAIPLHTTNTLGVTNYLLDVCLRVSIT
jgi:hypothetical protein